MIFDRKRPLAVSRKLHANNIPADVAFAVGARDLGDRRPGSNDPLGHTDNHHITWRSNGGTHIDDLVRLSRRYPCAGTPALTISGRISALPAPCSLVSH